MTVYCDRCKAVNYDVESSSCCTACHKKSSFSIVPNAVYDNVRKSFPEDWTGILQGMRYDFLCDCWMVRWKGMQIGIEIDGYVHS